MESIHQLQGRFSFTDQIYTAIQFLNPKKAVILGPQSLVSVFDVLSHLSKFALPIKTNEKWRQGYLIDGTSSQMSCVEYWCTVLVQKNEADMLCFPNLGAVVST